MTPTVRRSLTVGLLCLAVLLVTAAVWFLLAEAGSGDMHPGGARCGSAWHPAPTSVRLPTDCPRVLARERQAITLFGAGAAMALAASLVVGIPRRSR